MGDGDFRGAKKMHDGVQRNWGMGMGDFSPSAVPSAFIKAGGGGRRPKDPQPKSMVVKSGSGVQKRAYSFLLVTKQRKRKRRSDNTKTRPKAVGTVEWGHLSKNCKLAASGPEYDSVCRQLKTAGEAMGGGVQFCVKFEDLVSEKEQDLMYGLPVWSKPGNKNRQRVIGAFARAGLVSAAFADYCGASSAAVGEVDQ